MIKPINSIESSTSLLNNFNNRDSIAFGEIYTKIYKEIYYFSYSIFKNTEIDPKDILQDIFIKIWQKETLKFESLEKLKTYIYISVRNSFKMYWNHNKVKQDANEAIIHEMDLFTVYAAEAEIYSIIPSVINMLPKDCAESFKLFLEGYDVKEISEKLNKPLRTIYSQKEKAINVLKDKIPKDQLFIIMIMILIE